MVRNRLPNVDLLRGLVMVVMALDHVRDFTMLRSYPPTDMEQTTPALFFTRWITHFCAPVFVFLAGTGAYLYGAAGRTRPQLAGFLFTRGLWLIFLEVTVFRLWWTFNLDLRNMGGATFWAIGASMVVLSVLQFLPLSVVVGVGVAIIVGHNALDRFTVWDAGPLGGVWAVLHTVTTVPIAPGVTFTASYPLLPWIGVMAVGYGFGALLQQPREKRRRAVLALGGLLMVGFIVLRAINGYGDPEPWSFQKDAALTVCSFCNCHKYPLSLSYILMTLGPALVLLALTDREPGWLGERLIVFGRVPLFFYLIHLPLIHVFAFTSAYWQLGPWMFEFFKTDTTAGTELKGPLPEIGSLPLVYAIWVVVILILYPICAWYAGFKQRHRGSVLLSYL
jgi:uncharacterized membrane protein